MAIYAIWNNKGCVGKSYLTFQLASEYARQNQHKKVLVVDLCPQANSSSMLLGGMDQGETKLTQIHTQQPRRTISGYMEDRIRSPYVSPNSGTSYITQVSAYNSEIPNNVYLIVGDEQLETQSSRVSSATNPGPQDAWRIVHLWIRDLIAVSSWLQLNIGAFHGKRKNLTVKCALGCTPLVPPSRLKVDSSRWTKTIKLSDALTRPCLQPEFGNA